VGKPVDFIGILLKSKNNECGQLVMSADIHDGGCRVQLRETESETKVTTDPSVTAALVLVNGQSKW